MQHTNTQEKHTRIMIRKTFTFRSSWFEAMRNLSDNVRLALMDAICRYAIYGEVPSELSPEAEVAFILIRSQIDSAPVRRRKESEAENGTGSNISQEPLSADRPECQTERDIVQRPVASETDDPFDRTFSALVEKVNGNMRWRKFLESNGGIVNFKVAAEEFREYIRRHGLMPDFTIGDTGDLNESWMSEFCQRLLIAESRDHFLSSEARRRM